MTKQNKTRRRYLSALAGAATIGVAGCSSGGGDSGDDGGEANDTDRDRNLPTFDRDVVTEVRAVTRVESGTQVAYLDVSLVNNHKTNEMSLMRDGTEIQTKTVELGAKTVSFETGRDVEEADILEAGDYTVVSRAAGEVVDEYPTPLQKAVEIKNVEVGQENESQEGRGIKTFRFDVNNVGELPIDFKEGYVTGDVPRPGEPDGIRQQLLVEYRLTDQWAGPSDGLQTVESFPGGEGSSSTPVLIQNTPLEAPIDGELRANYCDGSPREATIHLRGKDGYQKNIDVQFSLSELFGDTCLKGDVISTETQSG